MMLRGIVLAVAALSLTACVSLFPKAEPASLYKLNPPAPRFQSPAVTQNVTVLRAPTLFTRTASGDRIMTVTGSEAAAIGKARWAAPASVMFDEAVSSAFDAAYPGVRLITRGEPAAADAVLRLEVMTFEAQYRDGAGLAPTVQVSVRGSLTGLKNRAAGSVRVFHAEAKAGDNRVGAIVEAYDIATGKLLGELVRWANDSAPALTQAPAPATL